MARKSVKAAESGKTENKTARVNFLLYPAIKRDIEKLAYLKRTSLNDLTNTVFQEYIAAHQADIAKYDSIFGEGGE